MVSKVDCLQCGAALPVPDDLGVVALTCRYCGAQQPVPDLEARRHALAEQARAEDQRRFSSQIQAEVLHTTRTATNLGRWMAIPGLLIGGIALVAGLLPVLKMTLGASLPTSWDGKSAFDCDGNDEKKISGVTATVFGTAIYARGNCHLTIEDCHIRAQTGVDASGNAHVIIKGGSMDAAVAVDATANASVDNRGGKVHGKVKHNANARVTGLP